MNTRKKNGKNDVRRQALGLLRDPQYLYRASKKIEELGVVGEERNRLIIFLAGLTRSTAAPASVLIKGSTSSGKTTLVKTVVQLFPSECVIARSGLSGKALAHGEGSLAQKILFLHEYRCGKDAQLLLRLLQSDGQIKHEFTAVRGSKRSTLVADRIGMPVVLTTTTDQEIYPDDSTRFLSLDADESAEQNLRIVLASAAAPKGSGVRDLDAWRESTSLLLSKRLDFENPPVWLGYVARRLPLGKVRVRRDWVRFLSFCKAIALIRSAYQPNSRIDINFGDYCVAHRIFEPVFASTLRGVRIQEMEICRAVTRLYRRLDKPVSAKEIAAELAWKESLVYKYLPEAVRQDLVEYEPGNRATNLKLVRPSDNETGRFLPTPITVLRANKEIGTDIRYCDPFTGELILLNP
jgi:hypothetical protein